MWMRWQIMSRNRAAKKAHAKPQRREEEKPALLRWFSLEVELLVHARFRAWFKNHDYWVSVRTLSAAAQVDEFGNLSRD